MDFGKPFPTGDTSPNGLAPDNVRAALNYSMGKGYTDNNAAQVELAIWYLRDNTWHNTDNALGQEVVTNATAANAPQASTGTSLADAVAQNKATVTAKFVPQTADAFYGDGQAVIRNTGTTDLQLYMPVGTVFSAGAGSTFQNLAAYALSNQPAQATVTAGATTSPSVTAAATITGTAVVTGTATVGTGTATAVVTGTATVGTGTATAETSPTALGTATAETSPTVAVTTTVETSPTALGTSTAVGTVAAETPTTVATVAASTATEVATATVEATATTGVVETPTAAPGSGVLPQTGNSDGGSTIMLVGLLTAVALLVVGTGAAVAARNRA